MAEESEKQAGEPVVERSPVALLLIDVINTMDFAGSEDLVRFAEPMAEQIAGLKARAAEAEIPRIYVNDNFGRWRSDFRRTVEICAAPDQPGHEVTRILRPTEDDYFVLKPMHSGFYATALEVLLERLGARTLILTGIAGNLCVLFTANDAYMRHYRLVVPHDCTASNSTRDNDQALEQMERFLDADTRPAADIDFAPLIEHKAE